MALDDTCQTRLAEDSYRRYLKAGNLSTARPAVKAPRYVKVVVYDAPSDRAGSMVERLK